MITTMFCYFSVKAGDCVVLKDAAGQPVKTKSLPAHIHYTDFARNVNRYGGKAWRFVASGPGSFHFVRIAR